MSATLVLISMLHLAARAAGMTTVQSFQWQEDCVESQLTGIRIHHTELI